MNPSRFLDIVRMVRLALIQEGKKEKGISCLFYLSPKIYYLHPRSVKKSSWSSDFDACISIEHPCCMAFYNNHLTKKKDASYYVSKNIKNMLALGQM